MPRNWILTFCPKSNHIVLGVAEIVFIIFAVVDCSTGSRHRSGGAELIFNDWSDQVGHEATANQLVVMMMGIFNDMVAICG